MTLAASEMSVRPAMSALDAIMTRVSSLRLRDPGPTEQQLQTILAAGAHAPDHGRMTPWRFVIIVGDQRERFGRILADSRRRANPEAGAQDLETEAAKALRAPTIVAVAARPSERVGVPEVEQVLSAAAAAQNMFLAAHALGLGAMWKTGAAAYDPQVKTALGLLAEDHIVGFLYIGAPERSGPLREFDLEPLVLRL